MVYYNTSTANYSGTSSTAGNIWCTWSGGSVSGIYTTTASATTSASTAPIWNNWVSYKYENKDDVYYDQHGKFNYPNYPVLSKSELALLKKAEKLATIERRKQQELYAKQQREKELAKKKADSTALKLLQEFLDAKQIKDLQDKNGFYFIADNGKTYRIDKGTTHNVLEVEKEGDDFTVKRSLCRHIKDNVPVYDNMLAQYLHMVNDVDGFIKGANVGRR
jgi:hypothetical protein